MTGYFVLFGGIMLFAAIITLLDWLAQRKERQSENHPTA